MPDYGIGGFGISKYLGDLAGTRVAINSEVNQVIPVPTYNLSTPRDLSITQEADKETAAMITIFITLVTLAGAIGAPTVSTPMDANSVIQAMFARGDANHDGVYSKAEALAIALTEDKDGDKRVSVDEYIQSWKAINPKFAAIGRGIFNRFDVDKNGFIEKVDIDSGYALVDSDGNGEINNLEFTAYMSIVLSALLSGINPTTPPFVPPSVPEALIDVTFPNDDTNKDGYLSFDEEWKSVQNMDLDGDGRISKVQFVQVFSKTSKNDGLGELWPAIFDVVDFDRNGYLEKGDVVKIFKLYDGDGNGLASKDEVKAGFRKLNSVLAQGSNYTDEQDYGFEQTDSNKDGRLTLSEEWAYMQALDVNGDGQISQQELSAITITLSYAIQNATNTIFMRYDNNSDGFFQRGDVAAYFNDIDSNGDGSVSKNSFVTFIDVMYANLGADIRTESANADSAYAGLRTAFTLYDTNHDNLLSVDEEFQAILALDQTNDTKLSRVEYLTRFELLSPKVQVAGQKIFDFVDSDKSGFLDRSDVVTGLKLLDTDGNGGIDINEYVNGVIKLYAKFGVSLSEFIPQTQTSSSRAILQTAFNQADVNGDGNISIDEQWATLLPLDTNGDHKLSRPEYGARYNNLPDLYKALGVTIFAMFDLDKNGFMDKTDITRGFPKVDADGNGLLSFSEFSSFIIELYASLGLNINGPTGSGSVTAVADYGFGDADVNKDGILTVAEEWAVMKKLDTNGDGKISEAEYVTVANISAEFLKYVFDLMDTDNNTFVEQAEYAEDFKVFDTNKDGKVTKTEYVEYVAELFASITTSLAKTNVSSDLDFAQIDANKDGLITFDEEWAAVVALDKDGDNRVSYVEFVEVVEAQLGSAAAKIFVRTDTNDDGYFEKSDIRKFVNNVDTNGDGSMSPGEYSSYVKGLLDEFGVDISQLG